MCKWLVVSFLPGDHPDRVHAEQVARLLYGDDVMLVQSVASWEIAESERQAHRRDCQRDDTQLWGKP